MIINIVRGNLRHTFFILLAILFIVANPAYSADIAQKSAAGVKESWERTLAEAKKEGKVMIYGDAGPDVRVALTKAIKEELGFDLDLVPGKSNEISIRFATELRAGIPSADMLLGGSTTVLTTPEVYNNIDKLEPLLMLPEVLDPKVWPNGKLPFLDSQKKMIPLVLAVDQLLVVNTNLVKPGQIKSFKDLLQPQWKGKIVMYDPTINGTAQTWVKLLLLKAYGPVDGEAFLKKFAAQEPVITRDARQPVDWVARGRYPVCIGIDPQTGYQMQKNGAPIARLAAEEGSFLTGTGSYIEVSAKRPHPHAAVVLLNWLLTARGEEIFSNAYGGPAARLGIKTEGVSKMAYPLPGEKLFLQNEESVLFKKAGEVAKRIFTSQKQ